MIAFKRIAAALALLTFLEGCSSGVLFNSGIYSHTTTPLTINMNPTETASTMHQADGEIHHLQFQVGVLWGMNGIGEIARKNGMDTIYYADIERLRVLFGIWQEDIVHVYGR